MTHTLIGYARCSTDRQDLAAQRMGIDEMRNRERRRDLAELAHPQRGVNTLASAFPGADGRPEGVRDTVDEHG